MTHLLLAGSYAPADQPGIYAFAFDPTSGALDRHGAFAGVANPSFLVLHPNQRYLYAASESSVGEGSPGAVWAFALEPTPFSLRPLGSQPSGGDHPCHLSIDPSGRWLVVANYSGGNISVLPIQPDGALGAATAHVQHHGRGPNQERQDAPHAHSSIFDRAGQHLLVADLGLDRLVVYRFDNRSGELSAHGHAAAQPGAGPRHMAFDASGSQLYVANELDNTLSLYSYASERGTLSERQTVATLPADAPAGTVADLHLAADGTRAYVSNRGHDSIAVFAVSADSRLERLATPSCGGAWPRNFALAPGGDFIVVANQHSGELVVMPLLAGAEAIGAPVAVATVAGASCAIFAGTL